MIKKIKTNFFDVRYLPEKKFLISQKIDSLKSIGAN